MNTAPLSGLAGGWTRVLAVAAVVIAAGALVGAATAGSQRSTAASKSELAGYTKALAGPTAAAGQVVEKEMKPSVAEMRAGEVDPAVFRQRARGWQIALARARRRIDGIAVPVPVREAAPLFDTALESYRHAAAIFEQAGAAAPDKRSGLLDEGVAEARRADQTYNRGAVVVQKALRAAGLPPDLELPDQAPSN